ncbi:SIMPL domain-containing protein [Candidatus Daviesbacteria bacterium]|nr:SIMPL domain-containing protein [Candidatus Daviesbacteria bacterium]
MLKLTFSILLSLSLFFILLFAYTKLAGPIPFTISSVVTNKSNTFDVSGEGKATVKPDIALISLGVSATAPTAKAAQDQMNLNINKVSDAVKKLGVEAKDIQTQNYNINPIYDNGSFIGSSQKITGYSADTNLSVKVRNLDTANKVLDAATVAGANQIGGISFEVEDRAKAESEARTKAVAQAKQKAAQASQIAGFRLGRVINYSEGFNGGIVRPLGAAKADMASQAPTQIEPGSSEIDITVTLSYEIL